MKTFLSIGECMIELASLGGDLMRKGFAGDTFNTAWYAESFLPQGWQVDYATALGDDTASAEMLAFMKQAGIGTRFITTLKGRAPGLYMIHLHNGERSFSYWRSAAAARHLADDRAALERAIAAADIVYFSGITLAILEEDKRTVLLELAAAARKAGKLVAFDPNIRPKLWASIEDMRSAIEAAAATASLVLPGFDDEATHFGDSSVRATVDRYHRLGVEAVVVKDGVNGATLSLPGLFAHVPACNQPFVVDTTSAGDSFNAGYLAQLASGQAPEAAARFAARLAAAVIGHPGALISRQALGL